jgi:hypothetical protein
MSELSSVDVVEGDVKPASVEFVDGVVRIDCREWTPEQYGALKESLRAKFRVEVLSPLGVEVLSGATTTEQDRLRSEIRNFTEVLERTEYTPHVETLHTCRALNSIALAIRQGTEQTPNQAAEAAHRREEAAEQSKRHLDVLEDLLSRIPLLEGSQEAEEA